MRRVVGVLAKRGHLFVTAVVLIMGLASPGAVTRVAAVSQTAEPVAPPPVTLEQQQKALYVLIGRSLKYLPKPADCSVEACVALTFDDGPDLVTTPQIIATLEQAAIPGTFFVIGNKIAGHEAILQRMITDHDEIGNHSWDHPNFTKLTTAQIQGQINATQAALVAAGVPAAKYFRAPYGAVNQRVVNGVPLPIILWNVDPKDWAHDEPNQDINDIMANVKPGAIIIMHDTKQTTVRALPTIITELKARHYRLVTVSQLLNLPADARGVYRGR